jgi:hypothetical protein
LAVRLAVLRPLLRATGVILAVVTLGGQQAPPGASEALTAAYATRDPAARLAALEKIRADYPGAPFLGGVDYHLLSTLLTWPDRLDAITAVVDRILARIPANASPDERLSWLLAPAGLGQLVNKKVLLDRSETLITEALAAFNLHDYATRLKETARRGHQPEPPQATIERQFNSLRALALNALGRIHRAKRASRSQPAGVFFGAIVMNCAANNSCDD